MDKGKPGALSSDMMGVPHEHSKMSHTNRRVPHAPRSSFLSFFWASFSFSFANSCRLTGTPQEGGLSSSIPSYTAKPAAVLPAAVAPTTGASHKGRWTTPMVGLGKGRAPLMRFGAATRSISGTATIFSTPPPSSWWPTHKAATMSTPRDRLTPAAVPAASLCEHVRAWHNAEQLETPWCCFFLPLFFFGSARPEKEHFYFYWD